MNICIFDTETTSLDKPFCYNIGYIIADTETRKVLVSREYVVEQVWHNLPLFETAYYANKRPLYVQAMRAHTIKMDKFGYICAQMRRDFKQNNVECAFAYNSSFDEKVFNFNCDWFKCINPFEEIPVKDIRGFVHHFIVNRNYLKFCDENEYYTETGNYSTTAETVYRFITKDTDFIEAHTALNDAQIEMEILFASLNNGAQLNSNYTAFRSIKRDIEKELHIRTAEQIDYYFNYTTIRINKAKTEITLI